MVNGRPLHGLVHPEMGHLVLPHDLNEDPFPGICPFHKDCFEGLASGPSINHRWGRPAETLLSDHAAWVLEAKYISLALRTIICTLSPQKIVLGGGVMQQSHLFPMIRSGTLNFLNGYVRSESILDKIDTYIVPPALGARAGVLGALALCDVN
jgi:fructokinase